MMKIAIIDSGVNLDYKDFTNRSVESISMMDDQVDKNGHGTACCGECMLIDPDSSILMIKVLDDAASGSLFTMVKALEYCSKRADIGIISISISCIVADKNVKTYVQHIINVLYNKGILIIAANENGMRRGFPASLKHVVAVDYKKSNTKGECLLCIGERCIYFGKNRLMPWSGGSYKFFSGNSSAVPRAAALFNKSIKNKNHLSYMKILKLFFLNFKEKNVEDNYIHEVQLNKILQEYYIIWKKKGWKTEEDCLKALEYLGEKGGIEVDPKLFCVTDFDSYYSFTNKCIKVYQKEEEKCRKLQRDR